MIFKTNKMFKKYFIYIFFYLILIQINGLYQLFINCLKKSFFKILNILSFFLNKDFGNTFENSNFNKSAEYLKTKILYFNKNVDGHGNFNLLSLCFF